MSIRLPDVAAEWPVVKSGRDDDVACCFDVSAPPVATGTAHPSSNRPVIKRDHPNRPSKVRKT